MAPKSVTFRQHDHLVSVLFGDLLSHSNNITFSMFLYLVLVGMASKNCSLFRGRGSTFQVVRPFNDKLEVVRPFGKNSNSSKYAK